MKKNIPTRPREGSVQGVSIAGTGSVLIPSPLKIQFRFKMKPDSKALFIRRISSPGPRDA
jgi:hypothetical protein